MGRKPPKFGRKPQIQLEGTTTKQPTFGLGYQPAESSSEAGGDGKSHNQGSAASFSLLASYGDSDTDDDDAPQREELQKPTKPIVFHKQMFVKADTLEPLKGSSPAPASGSSSPAPEPAPKPAPKQTENAEKKKEEPQKELTEDDLKLKAFLSEIDAMDPGDAPTPPAAEDCQSSESEEEEEEEKPEPAEAKPTEPTAPTTPWQHCLDEGTQHYYYWHVHTNEVTWEIPADYSQHLLRVKEHELVVTKYKRDLAAWEKREEARQQREKERQERAEEKRLAKAKRAEERASRKKAAELESAKAAALKEPTPVVQPSNNVEVAEDSLSELDVDRQLEEAVEATYKVKSKPKPAATEEKGEDTLDMDDIEKQLDMALEEKTKVKKEEKHERKPASQKRKGSGSQPNMPSKRPRQEEAAENGIVVSRLSMEDIKGKMTDMEKAVELSDILADKLQFLGATTETMSVPQMLLVQLEARLSDWRSGGLRTWRLLEMLSQSAVELERYESTVSTPAGWACHWHREYKRYFYCHEVTGDSQWDFPQEEPDITQLVLDPRGPPPPPPVDHHPHIPSSEDHHQADDSSADNMNSIYDVTLVKGDAENDLNGADLDGIPLADQKKTDEKLANSKPSTASLVMDYEDSEEEEDMDQTRNEGPVVQTPAVSEPPEPVAAPQPPEEPPVQPAGPQADLTPGIPTVAQAPQTQTSVTVPAPTVAQPPPPPPPAPEVPSHQGLQKQDLLQALSAAPPPPPPEPVTEAPTAQQQQVPGVNFMYLASAPPPPPPPPDNPGPPAESLEPGELADSEEEDQQPKDSATVPGNPATVPGFAATQVPGTVAGDAAVASGYTATGNAAAAPGYVVPENVATVAANPVVAPGYASTQVPGDPAAPVVPGSAEGATLDDEAPGSGAVIQAPPAPAEIEAPPVQLVAPPVLIEKTNGAAPSSPPHTSSSSSSSSRHHEKKKKKKDKDKEKGLVSGKLSMKKKKVPSLVEKWQNVQKEVASSKSKDKDDK